LTPEIGALREHTQGSYGWACNKEFKKDLLKFKVKILLNWI